MSKDTRISAQQEAFCQAYVTCNNGAAAARTAGYSELAAKEQASRLLTRPHVQERLRELVHERLDHLQPIALAVLEDMMVDPSAPHRDRRAAAEAILERGYLRRVSRTETEVRHTIDVSGAIAEVWNARQARLEAQGTARIVPLLTDGGGGNAHGSHAGTSFSHPGPERGGK
jgi:phage terminase small subunit